MQLVKPSFAIEVCRPGGFALQNIERAGRTCYKSEAAITEESAAEFVAMIQKRGHESVIEHESATVRFVIDRGVSHELVRHRLCAFSQESTRYCNYKGGVSFVLPPWCAFPTGDYGNDNDRDSDVVCCREGGLRFSFSSVDPGFAWLNAMQDSERAYLELLTQDWTPQQARSVLPNSLKTEIVVTANLREWRHIFKLRCAKSAHPQMREIMCPLRGAMAACVPVIFDDLLEDDDGSTS